MKEDKQKIVILDEIFTKQQLFEEEQSRRREQARFSFEDKIRILVNLQRLARRWGRREEIIVWEI